MNADGALKTNRFAIVVLILALASLAFAAVFLNMIDRIVHGTLYGYGLYFSSEWAEPYWMYLQLVLLGLGVLAVCMITFFAFCLRAHAFEVPAKARMIQAASARVVSYAVLILGASALAISVLFSSQIPAFIGLGLIFWGAILFYVQPGHYVKEDLLDATTLSSLITLDHVIKELDYAGKGVCLPPKYFRNPETNKVYVPKQKNGILPLPEQIQGKESRFVIETPPGILVAPPGAELAALFEKMLKTSFTSVDLSYLQKNLPELLVEDLEMAEDFDMQAEGRNVNVQIQNSAYRNIAKQAAALPNSYGSLGCPLSSAVACALAKATGKMIRIESQKTSSNGKTTEIRYQTIEGEQARR